MQPRLIRLRDAPNYLGMDRNRFNKEVRSTIPAIRIGSQGIAFDRLDLDNWVEHYKHCNGLPSLRSNVWQLKKCRGLQNAARSGGSINKLTDSEFTKALDQMILKKRKDI